MPPLQASTLIVPNAHLLAFQIGMGGGQPREGKRERPLLDDVTHIHAKMFWIKEII
jgi:hypothetical protein